MGCHGIDRAPPCAASEDPRFHGTVRELDAFLHREAILIEKAPIVSVKLRDESDLPVVSEAVAAGQNQKVAPATKTMSLVSSPSARAKSAVSPKDRFHSSPTYGASSGTTS